LAREALAALASKEDFASVNLRKSGDSTPTLLPPYKDLMLLHIKGRRRVQTRLVSPSADSINQGDSYVLVTPSQVRFTSYLCYTFIIVIIIIIELFIKGKVQN